MPPVRRSTQKDRVIEATKKRKADKPLPLVERTNKLSLGDFVARYVRSEELQFQRRENIEKPRLNPGEKGENTGEEAKPSSACRDQDQTAREDAYALDIYTAATIPATDLEACFNLIEMTSSDAYRSSSMGWSPTEKKKEMKLPDMKYMILRRAGSLDRFGSDGGSLKEERRRRGEFLGFLEFMVTYEDGYKVLYCYEIHLAPEVQGQRLGEELMGRFEGIGRRIGLEKAMLTVFKSNRRAGVFYDRIGYTEDENSPRPRKLRNGTVKEADYQILSKSLK